jgi:hypothetical protein
MKNDISRKILFILSLGILQTLEKLDKNVWFQHLINCFSC